MIQHLMHILHRTYKRIETFTHTFTFTSPISNLLIRFTVNHEHTLSLFFFPSLCHTQRSRYRDKEWKTRFANTMPCELSTFILQIRVIYFVHEKKEKKYLEADLNSDQKLVYSAASHGFNYIWLSILPDGVIGKERNSETRAKTGSPLLYF